LGCLSIPNSFVALSKFATKSCFVSDSLVVIIIRLSAASTSPSGPLQAIASVMTRNYTDDQTVTKSRLLEHTSLPSPAHTLTPRGHSSLVTRRRRRVTRLIGMSRPTLYRRLVEQRQGGPCRSGQPGPLARRHRRGTTTVSDRLTVRLISPFTRASARKRPYTHSLRQTLRQPRNVTRTPDDRTGQAHSATGPGRARAVGRHGDERPASIVQRS
jgi:hypothetical protein